MQKKIIALAVAGLVSGAAFAQSNVTVYGIVDMGYQYSWDNSANGAKSMSEIKSGGLDGSRVGVKGVEDLGNGLKAEFDATWAFKSDINDAVTMGEGSSVALSGNFGKVRAGYFGNFLDDNTGVDASGRHGMINTGSLYGTGKYENFLAYYSPSFSGLQFKAGFSSSVGKQDVAPTQDQSYTVGRNVRAYTAAVSYENGPIKAGVAYATYRPQAVNLSVGSESTTSSSDWNAGVSYNFGVATVSLFGAQQKVNDVNADVGFNPGLPAVSASDATPSYWNKKTFWALGAAIPVTAADTVKLGYGQAKYHSFVDGVDNATGKAWDIVYLHSLSKRTTAYAMYGNLDGDSQGTNNNVLGVGTNGTYQQAINVGIRHTF